MNEYTFYWTNQSFASQGWTFGTTWEPIDIPEGNTQIQQGQFSDGATIEITVDEAATATLALSEGIWTLYAADYFTFSQLEQIVTLSCSYSASSAA